MFGYIVVNKPELKIKDFDLYRSFYCGLCDVLYHAYGRFAQLSLNFDMTFLSLLLSALYESKNKQKITRCIVHPIHKHQKTINEWTWYCAEMTIVLTYLKNKDDWQDEHKYRAYMMRGRLHKHYEYIKNKYPNKIANIEAALAENDILEKQNSKDLDALAACSGKMMAEICTPKQDEWETVLSSFGDYLGRFIYLMDAYDDLNEDKQKQRFNPLIAYENRTDFEDWMKEILEMMIANSAEAFEKLPILLYQDMIRNILYSGVWAKYDVVKKKRLGDEHE